MLNLSDEVVWAIYNDRRTPLKVVAYDHGVSISTVWSIQNKKTHRDALNRMIEVCNRFRQASEKRKQESESYKG